MTEKKNDLVTKEASGDADKRVNAPRPIGTDDAPKDEAPKDESDFRENVEHPEDELDKDAAIARNGGTLSQDDIANMPAQDRNQFHPNVRP